MVGEELSMVIQTNYVALLAWQHSPIGTALSCTRQARSHIFLAARFVNVSASDWETICGG